MFENFDWVPAAILAVGWLLFKNQSWWPAVVAALRKIFPAPAPGPNPTPGPDQLDWLTLLQEVLKRIEAQHGPAARLKVEQVLLESQVLGLNERMSNLQAAEQAMKGGAT